MVTLYWAPQSRAFRALWLLEEIGRPYEKVLVDIRAPGHPTADYLRINPMGKVPAVRDGAVTVAESGAISAYLGDRFPEAGLAPAIGDPDRARYLQWLFFSPGCIEGSFIEKFGKLELPRMAAGWGSFDTVMDVLETELSKGPWLLGDRFSAADVLIGADLQFGVEVFKLISGRPAIEAYVERCKARPAHQRAVKLDAPA